MKGTVLAQDSMPHVSPYGPVHRYQRFQTSMALYSSVEKLKVMLLSLYAECDIDFPLGILHYIILLVATCTIQRSQVSDDQQYFPQSKY